MLAACSTNDVDDFLKTIVKAPPASIEYNGKGHSQIYADVSYTHLQMFSLSFNIILFQFADRLLYAPHSLANIFVTCGITKA